MKTFAQAVHEFRTQYPMATIGDLQSFTLGWQSAIDSLEYKSLPDWLSIKDFEHAKFLYEQGEKIEAVKHIYSFAKNHMDGGAFKWSLEFIKTH